MAFPDDVVRSCFEIVQNECERCRNDFNVDQPDHISKEDTVPNIYVHLETLELRNQIKYNYSKESLPTNLVAVAQ